MRYGLWPYVVAIVDTHACEMVCADCASEQYDGATFNALVDGDASATPEHLSVVLGGSEDLLDVDAPHTMGRYGDMAPSRTCDACGEPFVDVEPYTLPF